MREVVEEGNPPQSVIEQIMEEGTGVKENRSAYFLGKI